MYELVRILVSTHNISSPSLQYGITSNIAKNKTSEVAQMKLRTKTNSISMLPGSNSIPGLMWTLHVADVDTAICTLDSRMFAIKY